MEKSPIPALCPSQPLLESLCLQVTRGLCWGHHSEGKPSPHKAAGTMGAIPWWVSFTPGAVGTSWGLQPAARPSQPHLDKGVSCGGKATPETANAGTSCPAFSASSKCEVKR